MGARLSADISIFMVFAAWQAADANAGCPSGEGGESGKTEGYSQSKTPSAVNQSVTLSAEGAVLSSRGRKAVVNADFLATGGPKAGLENQTNKLKAAPLAIRNHFFRDPTASRTGLLSGAPSALCLIRLQLV